jgi:uncharacterized protein YjiS (DUF1127 family)
MINLLETSREKRLIRKTHQRLYGLSDQILADIGLTRAEIPSVGLDGLPRNRHGR